jgi:protein TonB
MEQAELTAQPPRVVAPEAIPLPVEKPKPKVIVKRKPVVEDDRPTPAELRAEARRRAESAERRRKAQEARQARRRGTAQGGPSSGMSRGNYAGLLAAELRRHQFYPASARSEGVTGSVSVAFTVGASGRVVSQSITSSSGNAALDGAAHAMMRAVHTPPPPDGHFSTSTTIRFHLD